MERRSNRRGNYTMLMGFSVVGILGFGALGVDISYIAMANTQASAVSDAASHAALLSYRQSSGSESDRQAKGRRAADWIVDNNDVGFDGPGQLDALEFGVFNPESGAFTPGGSPANAARAEVTRRGGDGIELMLAPIIGKNQADVVQSGVTVANPREIMVVVDKSCSMDWGYPLSGKVGTDRALETFSSYMVGHQVPKDRMGITWFSSSGGWFDSLKYVGGNEGAILSKWASWDRERMRGSTNQAAGIRPAHTALATSGNDLAFKAIIVISDGNPNPSRLSSTFLSSTSDAWRDGIHVWTVAFGSRINDRLMRDATKGLGTYEKTPDSRGLSAVMLKIAESIPVAVVQ